MLAMILALNVRTLPSGRTILAVVIATVIGAAIPAALDAQPPQKPTPGESPPAPAYPTPPTNADIERRLQATAFVKADGGDTFHDLIAELAWTHHIPIRLDESTFRPHNSSSHVPTPAVEVIGVQLRSLLKTLMVSHLPKDEASHALIRPRDGVLGISVEKDAYDEIAGYTPGGVVPMTTLRGSVRHADGSPAPNARVEIWSYAGSLFVTADEQGRFSTPVHATHRWSMVVLAKTPDKTKESGLAKVPVPKETEETPPLEIVLAPPASVDAQVSDGQSNPVADANVAILIVDRPLIRGKTDSQGRFTVSAPADLPIDAVVVWKNGQGLDYQILATRTPDFQRVSRTLASLSGELKFQLAGAKSVTIALKDDAGKPLEGVRLYPFVLNKGGQPDGFNMTQIFEFGQRTNESGETMFEWLPTWAFGSLTISSHSRKHGQWQTLVSAADPSGKRIDGQLTRKVQLSGRVRNPDGRPAEGAEVRIGTASHSGHPVHITTNTDPTGEYSFLVDPDHICLIVARSVDGQLASPSKDDVITFSKVDLANIDLQLQPATRVIGKVETPLQAPLKAPLQVSITQSGRDIKEIPSVQLPDSDNARWLVMPNIYTRVVVAADGTFETFVGPGKHRFSGPGGPGTLHTVTNEKEIRVAVAGPKAEEKLILKGTVVAGDPARPVPEARIRAFDKKFDLPGLRAILADKEGRFETERVPHEMTLYVYSPDRKLGAVVPIDGRSDTTTVELTPTAKVHFRLLTPDGEPWTTPALVGAKFRPTENSTSTFDPPIAPTKEGRVEFPDLIVGASYSFEISMDGGKNYRSLKSSTINTADPLDLGDITVNPPNESAQ
jgi:protocatechuate 3,4-dioxygenase beta subunit